MVREEGDSQPHLCRDNPFMYECSRNPSEC
jgi:hypothetical protein